MKIASNVFLIIALTLGIACSAFCLANYDAVLYVFADMGYDVSNFLTKEEWIRSWVMTIVEVALISGLSLFAVNKKPLSPAFLLTMGILSLFMLGLLPGLFMLLYYGKVRQAELQGKARNSEYAPKREAFDKREYAIDPKDYEAPSPEAPKEEPKPLIVDGTDIKVGDRVLTSGGKIGKVTAISYSQANVSFEDGSGDRILSLSSLSRIDGKTDDPSL